MTSAATESMQLFGCSECSYKTPSVRKLGRHKSVNHSGVKYRCEMCDFVTGYQSNYYRHRKQVHNVGSPSSMAAAAAAANASNSPRKNASTSKPLFSAPPPIIKAQQSTPFASSIIPAALHQQQQIPTVAPFIPSQFLASAGYDAPSSLDLAAFQNLNLLFLEHILKFPCPHCFSRFPTEQTLQQHVASLHSAPLKTNANKKRPYQCLVAGCHGYKTEKSRDFLHHLKQVHGQQFDIFYCDQCYYATKEAFKLSKHYELVHAKNVTVSSKADSITLTTSPKTEPVIVNVKPIDNDEKKEHVDSTDSNKDPRTIDDDDDDLNGNLVIADPCNISGDGTTSSPSLATPSHSPHLNAEPVAIKANDESFPRNSLAEIEHDEADAMEMPDEKFSEIEMNDPDVKSCICSICGYNAKWVSEMIRHKRVHTDERPFKCKYCGRTSKWKADMIRHITKVHGIRIISKGSRSSNVAAPAPSNNNTNKNDVLENPDFSAETALKRENAVDGLSPASHTESDRASFAENPSSSIKSNQSATANESSDPHRSCSEPTNKKFRQSSADSEREKKDQTDSVRENLIVQQQRLAEFILAQATLAPNHIDSPSSNNVSQKQPWLAEVEKYAAIGHFGFKCRVCKYATRDLHTFRAHVQKHENKKPYQCSACGYRSNWSSDVHKHIRLKKSGHVLAQVIKLSDQVASIIIDRSSAEDQTNESAAFDDPTNHHQLMTSSCFAGLPLASAFPVLDIENRTAQPIDNNTTLLNQQALFIDMLRSMASGIDSSLPIINDASLAPHSDINLDSSQNDMHKQNDFLHCPQCPFSIDKEKLVDFDQHLKAHSPPKAIICYKCHFCSFYSKKKLHILEHMRLHTDRPQSFMGDVERNLITGTSLEVKAFSDSVVVNQQNGFHNDAPADVLDLSVNKRKMGRKNKPLEKCIDLCTSLNNSTGAAHSKNLLTSAHFTPPPQNINSDPVSFNTSSGSHSHVMNQFLNDTAAYHQQRQEKCEDEKSPMSKRRQIIDSSDGDSIDPEAYIHAGEEALGNEKLLFADMVPKDIQKVNAVVEGQMRKMWQCRYCTHISKRRANIRMHEKKHFKPNAVGLLKCPQCSYKGDKRSLKVHYRSHTISIDELGQHDRYQCDDCPATFRQQQVFAQHVTFHNGHHRYRCALCSYAVPSQHQLTQHAVVHRASDAAAFIDAIGDDDHPADDATPKPNHIMESISSSSSPSLLQNGQNNGDVVSNWSNPIRTLAFLKPKRLQCRFCPAKFAERSQIKRHEQFHGVQLKHNCPKCNYSVPFPINLLKHMRAHHNMEIENGISVTSSNSIPYSMVSKNSIDDTVESYNEEKPLLSSMIDQTPGSVE